MKTSMTKKDLATVAGYTYRRLYDIDRELPAEKKLFVPADDGKYDLPMFVQRWVAYNVENETGNIEDLDEVKAIHERVKIRKTELEVARMEGSLVDVADARKLWGDVAAIVTQNLLHLPSQLAPMLRMMENTETIAHIIDTQIRKRLEIIAETPLPDYAAQEEAESPEEEEEA